MQTITWEEVYQSVKNIYGAEFSEVKALSNANDVLDEIKRKTNLPTQIRETFIPYAYDFEKYALPTDYKTEGVISLKYDSRVDSDRNRIFIVDEPRPHNASGSWNFYDREEWNMRDMSDMACIDADKGVEALWLANGSSDVTNQEISACDSLTGWVGSGGASNLTLDSDYKVEGDYSINYDIASATEAIVTLTLPTAVDLSDYEDRGIMRFFKSLPTAPSQIEIRIGESATKYYTQTVTTQSDKRPFNTSNINELELRFEDATNTGNPDMSSVNYFQVILTFASATTDTDFRIDLIKAFRPEYLSFNYYSFYMVQDSSGDWQEKLTETTGADETVNLLPEMKRAFVAGIILPELEKNGDKRADKEEARYNIFLRDIQRKYPSKSKRTGNSYW